MRAKKKIFHFDPTICMEGKNFWKFQANQMKILRNFPGIYSIEVLENKKETSRRLIFLEPVNNYTDTEELVERLISKLESFGFNIVGKDKETKDES